MEVSGKPWRQMIGSPPTGPAVRQRKASPPAATVVISNAAIMMTIYKFHKRPSCSDKPTF